MARLTKVQRKQNEIAHKNLVALGNIARVYRQRWINRGKPADMMKSIKIARRYIRIFGAN